VHRILNNNIIYILLLVYIIYIHRCMDVDVDTGG
jgi:hypothetical protein